eukprot:4409541-Amphidinium_carterae.1
MEWSLSCLASFPPCHSHALTGFDASVAPHPNVGFIVSVATPACLQHSQRCRSGCGTQYMLCWPLRPFPYDREEEGGQQDR